MIDRDEAQKIREIFQKTGTIAETARITDHHRTTVRRVLTRDYSQPVKRRRKTSRWDRRIKDLLAQNIPLALRSKNSGSHRKEFTVFSMRKAVSYR